ncbi:hypothetical protein [Streptomyces sp. MAR4 CNX-425]|uniref:hypothetical protein n=1 Tax=Streptomyces sp. MAR4 CNX-425 TaxID=3406343 RepID=UPI003B51042C
MTAPARRTFADGPVTLPGMWPIRDATPAPGCGRCTDLADDRAACRAAGDMSAVSDANVLIRRHPTH